MQRSQQQMFLERSECKATTTDNLEQTFKQLRAKIYLHIQANTNIKLYTLKPTSSQGKVDRAKQLHRLAQDQLDHESKEEIFQHKMQAYDKIVFTPPTTDGVLALHSANTRSAWRKLLAFSHGRIYIQDCWNIIKSEY